MVTLTDAAQTSYLDALRLNERVLAQRLGDVEYGSNLYNDILQDIRSIHDEIAIMEKR